MTPEEERYEKEVEELEFKAGGVFAVATPEGHEKRWERKKELVRREMFAAKTLEEKGRLEQKLVELERFEKKIAHKLGELYTDLP